MRMLLTLNIIIVLEHFLQILVETSLIFWPNKTFSCQISLLRFNTFLGLLIRFNMAGASVQTVKEKILILYYIHPNETPSTSLVTILLDEKNFHKWRHAMIEALKMKNKI